MSALRHPEGLERWREALHAVDRSPGEEWRSRLVHHGSRILGVLAITVAVPFLFPRHSLPQFEDLREGERVGRDVVAEMPLTVYKSEDQLEAERREAERGISPIFVYDTSAVSTAVERVDQLFVALDSAVSSASSAVEEAEAGADTATEAAEAGADTAAIRKVLSRGGVPFTAEHAGFLVAAGRRELLRRSLLSAFRNELTRGVAQAVDLESATATVIRVRDPDGERYVDADSILTSSGFQLAAAARASSRLSPAGRDLYETLLIRFHQPTLVLDRDATRQAREFARSAVEAAAGYVLEGTTIVAAGERLDREDVEVLLAYQRKLEEEGVLGGLASFWRGLGLVIFSAVLLGLLAGVLFLFRPEVYREARSFALFFLLLFFVLAVGGVIAQTDSPPALIPIAFAALLIGALYDGLLALVGAMAVAAMLAGVAPFGGLAVPFATLSAGAAAALGIREIRRRSQSWILITVITGAYLLAGAALLMLGVIGFRELLGTVAWGGVNATASTALAMGAALPLLEKLTGRTTDQTLLELADLNNPVLRRLSREAPGTYAHSISLANLAEAACVAIGANALLARVGTYYHDVGKMLRPQYFVENQPKGMNPHDRLPPEKSAELIREHVREGLRMADEEGLPEMIKNFIREHHGTQKIAYFLAKAMESDPDAELDPNDFCYPGPKPQSKETAVVMLADAIESAARTLAEPTPDRIRALIDRMVERRIEAGQLDQCPLTLRDLDVIKGEFARVLTGLYHHRIDYPTEPSRTSGDGGRGGAGDRAAGSSLTAEPAAVEERDATVEERDAAVEERDATVEEHDATVEERNAAGPVSAPAAAPDPTRPHPAEAREVVVDDPTERDGSSST